MEEKIEREEEGRHEEEKEVEHEEGRREKDRQREREEGQEGRRKKREKGEKKGINWKEKRREKEGSKIDKEIWNMDYDREGTAGKNMAAKGERRDGRCGEFGGEEERWGKRGKTREGMHAWCMACILPIKPH